jgi:hypothetical protein
MARHDRTVLLAIAVVAVALALAHQATGAGGELLALLPPLLLAVPLLAGRYVGEGAIERLAARVAPAARLRRRGTRVPLRPAPSRAVSGGRLLAAGLARRGPPAFLLAG